MTDPVRKPDGSACGKRSAATLKPYAVPTPSAIRVNMFRWRVRSEFQPRTKNGQPAQRTTGVAKRNWLRTRHRSEEHTSELQSHLNLVCRLLLEKKKNI